ncbi:MAG: hypothetical protein ACFE9T_01995 [Promethearchaeota archaeon]
MHSNSDHPEADYESIINKLSNQITKLYNQIQYYQVLITQKERDIAQLSNENNQLKAQIQNLSLQPSPPSSPSQQSYTPPVVMQQPTSPSTSSIVSSTMKRLCPNCGAMGFAIKEVDDKSKIISYVPRRIYAKKRVCTKCRFEF